MYRVAYVAVLFAFMFTFCAMADDSEGDSFGPATKAAYGVTEVALCWTEVPRSVYYYSDKYDPVSGLLLGVAEGTILGVKDAVEGTVDTTFFLFPPYEKTGGKTFFEKLKRWDEYLQDHLW